MAWRDGRRGAAEQLARTQGQARCLITPRSPVLARRAAANRRVRGRQPAAALWRERTRCQKSFGMARVVPACLSPVGTRVPLRGGDGPRPGAGLTRMMASGAVRLAQGLRPRSRAPRADALVVDADAGAGAGWGRAVPAGAIGHDLDVVEMLVMEGGGVAVLRGAGVLGFNVLGTARRQRPR